MEYTVSINKNIVVFLPLFASYFHLVLFVFNCILLVLVLHQQLVGYSNVCFFLIIISLKQQNGVRSDIHMIFSSTILQVLFVSFAFRIPFILFC